MVGTGKNACGNSIIGNACFPTSDDVESCTHKNTVRCAKRKDIYIKVIGMPGVMDADVYRNLENVTLHLPELMSTCHERDTCFWFSF